MHTKYFLLENINFPSDLKKLNLSQMPELCKQLRDFIIEKVLQNGGHFAANLGVVELSVALHYVFDTPNDKIVWDVGHQAYCHKILTGRRKIFDSNRKLGGISGFPNIFESEFDAFGTGHSSTAISAILGMATASLLNNNIEQKHIAVVGDGALTGGESYEGLNNIAVSNTNSLIIINDNDIGIDKNCGAINSHLRNINHDNNLFTNLGLKYIGIVDGHNVHELISCFKMLKDIKKPCVVHIRTTKGKGYPEAEKEQTKWHSTTKFIKIEKTYETLQKGKLRYQDIFGQTLIDIAEKNLKVCGVTPAMPTGSGMIEAMNRFPSRFFDVGIAEQHAVTFSAGLAKEGFIVFCSIYSTFLQRALDQVIHDVCIQNLPVIFCIDRAGNAADDGATHHGLYDLPMLLPLPNITIATPANAEELRKMMFYYSQYSFGPVAIRYPKGAIADEKFSYKTPVINNNLAEITQIEFGKQIAIIAVGTMLKNCYAATKILNEKKIYPSLFSICIVKPLNADKIAEIIKSHKLVITVEDGSIIGGAGSFIKSINSSLAFQSRIISLGFPDETIKHGSHSEIFELYGISPEAIANTIFQNILP
ncbi:MAG: 1-deoxy-D-xylulose-5-phosphate synthase [Bacteroidia bacterium]|nr:1-deoxy-D-xylulose-5-phosphate synthase [Bacteroidia bacterium]